MRQASKRIPESAEKTVRDIRGATRRHHSAEEKIRIVLEGLRGADSIAELCRKEGINQNLSIRTSARVSLSWRASALSSLTSSEVASRAFLARLQELLRPTVVIKGAGQPGAALRARGRASRGRAFLECAHCSRH